MARRLSESGDAIRPDPRYKAHHIYSIATQIAHLSYLKHPLHRCRPPPSKLSRCSMALPSPGSAGGNGTGDASKTAIESGKVALESGILHLDTAQIYHNEKETGEAIKVAGVKREDVYVTSKRMFLFLCARATPIEWRTSHHVSLCNARTKSPCPCPKHAPPCRSLSTA